MILLTQDCVACHPVIVRHGIRLFLSAVLTINALAIVSLLGCHQGTQHSVLSNVKISLDSSDNQTNAVVTLSGLSQDTTISLQNASLTREDWTSLLRVTVHQPDSSISNIPPVLGDYKFDENGTVYFQPMFPFDPGLEYQVVFDPTALPLANTEHQTITQITTIISLPELHIEPSTIVSDLFPSGNTIPENQLKFYVEFSAPMSAVDGLDYIQLLNKNGQVVEAPFLPLGSEFWDYNHQRYTVFFDPGRIKQGLLPNDQLGRPLINGETYTIVISPNWPDAFGAPLKEEFRKVFTVVPEDITPLDLEMWQLRVPKIGTMQRLVVSFPEPLDRSLLMRGLAIEDIQGNRLDGESTITNWETRWSFSPSRSWQAGSYTLVALPILEDLAGNRIGVPFEIDVFDRIDETTEQETYRIPFEIH